MSSKAEQAEGMSSKAEQSEGMSAYQLKKMKTQNKKRFDALDCCCWVRKFFVENLTA